jgi:hypothetical protein
MGGAEAVEKEATVGTACLDLGLQNPSDVLDLRVTHQKASRDLA